MDESRAGPAWNITIFPTVLLFLFSYFSFVLSFFLFFNYKFINRTRIVTCFGGIPIIMWAMATAQIIGGLGVAVMVRKQ
jgi:hypothetical protein